MNFSEYCQQFYIEKGNVLLTKKRSQNKITEFFLDEALGNKKHLCTVSPDAYRKYFTGEREVPDETWDIIKSAFNVDSFSSNVMNELDDTKIIANLNRFGIKLAEGDSFDKVKFSFALSKQMKAIVENYGKSPNIISDSYFKDDNLILYSDYVDRAIKQYKNISILISEEDVDLEESYVCNSVLKKAAVRAGNKNDIQLDDPTLEELKTISSYAVLVGNGGSGKSMMLQHLVLKSLKSHNNTGLFPVMVNLGTFNCKDGKLIESIKSSVLEICPSFDINGLLEKILASGKMQLVLDGYDEIDPAEVSYFQSELMSFRKQYKAVQIVIASRECKALDGLTGFIRVHILPFNTSKCIELIDKLCPDDEVLNTAIKEYMGNNFFNKHTVFKSNPMLLTYIVKYFPIEEYFKGSQRLFYKKVYETILFGHDEQKPGYDRIFRSVSNSDEFTDVFREFCALTYKDVISRLDENTFSSYFNSLETKKSLSDPDMLSEQTFIRDVCTTACMMYEDRFDYYYIDQGFQEYMFADYQFRNRNEDEVKQVGKSFWKVSAKQFDSLDAFSMLEDLSKDKLEKLFFKPFLDAIFVNKKPYDSFALFLQNGFRHIPLNYTNASAIKAYADKYGYELKIEELSKLTPSTVILDLILKELNFPSSYTLEVNEDYKFLSDFRDEWRVIQKYVGFGGNTTLKINTYDFYQICEHPEVIKEYIFENLDVIAGYKFSIPMEDVCKRKDKEKELLNYLKQETILGKVHEQLYFYFKKLDQKFREVSFE